MSILTKTQVKNIFVTNAVPQQVDYSNWIDSCVFLNADGTVSLNSLVMPYSAPPPGAPLNNSSLFFNSLNGNRLSEQDSPGLITEVSPDHNITLPINQLSVGAHHALILKNYAFSVIGVTASIIGVGSFDLNISCFSYVGSVTSVIQMIATTSVVSISATDYTAVLPALLNSYFAMGKIISIGISNVTGTFDGNVTIEYREK